MSDLTPVGTEPAPSAAEFTLQEHPDAIPGPLREQRRRQRLRIASSEAFPCVHDTGVRAPRVEDAELLLAALQAVTRFTSRHASALRRGAACRGIEPVRMADGASVDVLIAYPVALPAAQPESEPPPGGYG